MIYAALVYSHTITPRLQYIVDFLSNYYGLSFKLMTGEDSYKKDSAPCKINYSFHKNAEEEIWIHSHELLFESAIKSVKIECFQHNGYKAFFKTECDTQFDIFAAIFYLITRYEEYLPHKKDMYGRYAHENSLAFREGFLQLPLINIWLEDFRKLLSGKNQLFATHFPINIGALLTFLPTYDIDIAWSFKNKGLNRNAGALLQLFFTGKWNALRSRIKVLRLKEQDPFDAYEWMDELHAKYGMHPLYFFLVAQKKDKYDKNIAIENVSFKQLLHTTALKYKVGLHPSWASGDLPFLLEKEKSFLEQITKQNIISSRQHYIRFNLPETYRRLIKAGIGHDYSMGYGSINGFRASITTSFYWYDLKGDEQTQLLIHPFCFMDANSFYEQQLSIEATAAELKKYYHAIKDVNGTMITIWHNSFLGNSNEFKGWREVYEQFVETVSEQAI